MHFFDISTSTKCSERIGFCTFDFHNVLHATTVCNFSSLICHFCYSSTLRGHKSLEENTVFRDFPTFLRTWIFFLRRLSLFDLLSSSLLFSSLTFSDSSHLYFSCVHIVGSLTSKLPSIKIYCVQRLPDMLKGLHSFKNIAFCFSFQLVKAACVLQRCFSFVFAKKH